MYTTNNGGLCWNCLLEVESLRRDESADHPISVHLCWTCAELWAAAIREDRQECQDAFEQRRYEGDLRRYHRLWRHRAPPIAHLRAAVDADPLDVVSRLAFADDCEERGDDAEAARQRLIATALRRSDKLSGPRVLNYASLRDIRRGARYHGRKVRVRLASQVEPEWYVLDRRGQRVTSEGDPCLFGYRPDGDYYAYNVVAGRGWNLRIHRPHVVTLEPGRAVVHRVDSSRSLVIYLHPEDWPHFARQGKLAACA
jgi:hypothetical protein